MNDYNIWQIERYYDSIIKTEEFQNKSLETFESRNFDTKIANQVVSTYFANLSKYAKKGEGFTIMGPKGVGKTHLLTACRLKLIELQVFAPLLRCTDICIAMQIAKNYYDKSFSEYDIIAKLSIIPILLIDDFLRGTKSFDRIGYNDLDWPAIFYAIINARYENKKPIFLTTNFKYVEMQAYLGEHNYGEFIVDRLKARNQLIWLGGKSQRTKEDK
jgi:DNA replication protein DnaC